MIAAVFSSCGKGGDGDVTGEETGKAFSAGDYSIVIPADADECMKYSAEVLKKYIDSSCGTDIQIGTKKDGRYIEFVKDVNDEYKLGDEGYHVSVSEDGDVTLTCGALRGSLYAAYFFLEEFCSWRFLTDDVEYLYEADNVDIPLGFTETEVPGMLYRGLNQVGVSKNGSGFSRLRLNALDARGSGNASSDARYGGGTGNLICRIVRGYVVDFINIHILPIFNAADIFVCCGCGLLVLSVLWLEPRYGKKTHESEHGL